MMNVLIVQHSILIKTLERLQLPRHLTQERSGHTSYELLQKMELRHHQALDIQTEVSIPAC